MNESLDRFLSGAAGQAAAVEPPVVAAEPTGEPVVVETPPDAAVTSTPEPAAPEAPVADDDDDAPPASGNGTVPVHVLQAERNKRNDWKTQAISNEAAAKAAKEALAALQAQLDELKKAPPAPPAPPAPVALAPPAAPTPRPPPEPMPNPVEDPEGYARWFQVQQARQAEEQAMIAFNLRLETTEDLLREKEGDEAVDKAVGSFKAMVAAEEATFGKGRSPLAQALNVQRNPYRWMYNQVRKAEADKEIGGDLTSYKAKIEAEIRAKVEAEMAEKAAAAAAAPVAITPATARTAPPVTFPRSLANAPSSAPRNSVPWTGPTPLGDIVPRR